MIKRVIVGVMAMSVGFSGLTAANKAFACNKTAGCAMDSFRDDYDMKRDGRMDEAIIAGRENMEAFRALQSAQQPSPAKR